MRIFFLRPINHKIGLKNKEIPQALMKLIPWPKENGQELRMRRLTASKTFRFRLQSDFKLLRLKEAIKIFPFIKSFSKPCSDLWPKTCTKKWVWIISEFSEIRGVLFGSAGAQREISDSELFPSKRFGLIWHNPFLASKSLHNPAARPDPSPGPTG